MYCDIIAQTFDGKGKDMAINTGFIINHTRAEKDFLNDHPLEVPAIYSPTTEIKVSPILTIINIQFHAKVEEIAKACDEIAVELKKASDKFITTYNANKNLLVIRDEIYEINDDLEIRKQQLTDWSDRVEDKIQKMIESLNVIIQACKTRQWDEIKGGKKTSGLDLLTGLNKGELWTSKKTKDTETNLNVC